nr:hypothetical protein Itr_chr03CG24250 [Ipomoea trifida]
MRNVEWEKAIYLAIADRNGEIVPCDTAEGSVVTKRRSVPRAERREGRLPRLRRRCNGDGLRYAAGHPQPFLSPS